MDKKIANLRASTLSVEVAYDLFKSGDKIAILDYMKVNHLLAKELNKDNPDIDIINIFSERMSRILNKN